MLLVQAMRVRTRRSAVAAALAVAALGGAACSGSSALSEATPSNQIKTLPANLVPTDVAGLAVKQEDMSNTLKFARRSYIDGVGLYSFRKGDLLQATLQVSRFNGNARYQSLRFRQQVINKVGGSLPKAVRVGGDTVYLTTGTKQSLSMWFRGRDFLILAVREDYPTPRTLLRQALELKV